MTSEARGRLLQACLYFMMPVARFLLRAGISYREFSELSKVAFVRVASEEFGIRGRPTNMSRIAAMTGIPRKDVSRIRSIAPLYCSDIRVELSPLGDVLHYWHTDPQFLAATGHPRKLSFGDGEDSFSALVKKRVGDVPAGAIRVELIRAGAVSVDDDGFLHVHRRHVIPEGADEKLVSSLSFGLRSLAETIAFNSSPTRVAGGRIERFVQSSPIKPTAIEALRLQIRRKIIGYTEDFDDIFSQHDSECTSTEGLRVGVGIFYAEEDSLR